MVLPRFPRKPILREEIMGTPTNVQAVWATHPADRKIVMGETHPLRATY